MRGPGRDDPGERSGQGEPAAASPGAGAGLLLPRHQDGQLLDGHALVDVAVILRGGQPPALQGLFNGELPAGLPVMDHGGLASGALDGDLLPVAFLAPELHKHVPVDEAGAVGLLGGQLAARVRVDDHDGAPQVVLPLLPLDGPPKEADPTKEKRK